ncbi:hypothetical protein [Enterococcus phage vB_Efm8_KEN21]
MKKRGQRLIRYKKVGGKNIFGLPKTIFVCALVDLALFPTSIFPTVAMFLCLSRLFICYIISILT